MEEHCGALVPPIVWTTIFARDRVTAVWIYVCCNRCGEAIQVRADRRYDLVSEMREVGEEGPAFTMHKDIVGQRCFQRITVTLGFTAHLQVSEQQITGGRFLTEAEYHQAMTSATPQQ